jgi:eukaryotic-like serine/threonine-protein kinase
VATPAEQAASTAVAAAGSGRVLAGRYALGPVLGTGGMAMVMAAHDLVLDRPVAVKVLREQFAADTVFLSRFTREALHASSLSHPGLVTIFDSGIDHGTAFIVMERVYGRTVREVLKSQGRFPVQRAVSIAASVCDVLEVTHRAGIVHRDIKPGNLLLADDGRLRVFDFGIARRDGADPLTQTATVMGTAGYLSPEQAAGQRAGPRSDLYAVGCVLMEMLTGAPPFDATTPVAALYRHVHDVPPLASAGRPEVPAALDEVVRRLLAKDPAQRPATAATARAELLAALSPRTGDTRVLPVATVSPGTVSPGTVSGGTVSAGTVAMPSVAAASAVSRPRRGRAVAVAGALLAVGALATLLGLDVGSPAASSARSPSPSATPTRSSAVPAAPVVGPGTPTPTLPTPVAIAVPPATSFSSAIDAVRTVIGAGQAAQLVDPAAAAQLMDAVNEVARSTDRGHGKSTASKVRDLTALVGTLSTQGLVTGDAVRALDQAVAQLSSWSTWKQ